MNYTSDMASYSLGIPRRNVNRLCQNGKINAFKGSKGWLIPESEVILYRKKMKIPKVEFWKAVERVKHRLYGQCPPNCPIDNCLEIGGKCLYDREE